MEIFHESEHLPPLTQDTPLDAHVLSMLLHAMRVGLPLLDDLGLKEPLKRWWQTRKAAAA